MNRNTSNKKSLLALSVVAGLSLANPLAQANVASERFIVKLNDNAVINLNGQSISPLNVDAAAEIALFQIASTANVEVIQTLPNQQAMAVELTEIEKLTLEADPRVEFVEVDPKRYLMAEQSPYGIGMVEADQITDSLTGNRKVCIVDTGYDLGHPDLPDAGVTGDDGYGNNDTGDWFDDGHGHGTHVAGTIAAIGNNVGVVGVNPSNLLGLHIVKVFNNQARWAYGSDLIVAIQQCRDAGANVISMSLGGSGSSAVEQQAFDDANTAGVLSIAAAGNGGNAGKSFPASYDAVVSVAAVDSSGNRASFSQFNDQVEIAGPGVSVLSTDKEGAYSRKSGTSMATPHVSGVAALVWSHFPECSNLHIRQALNESAEDKGEAGRDNYYGYGIVKAKAAYDYMQNEDCSSPVNPAPVVWFNFLAEGRLITFTDESTDDKAVASFSWDFDDGNTSSQQNPVHEYDSYGIYNVSLTVADNEGRDTTLTRRVVVEDSLGCFSAEQWSDSKTYKTGMEVAYKGYKYTATWWSNGAEPNNFPQVWRNDGKCGGDEANLAPEADFGFTTDLLTASFTDLSTDDGGVIGHSWTFGDDASSTEANPQHTYTEAGSYQVRLTVEDEQGLTSIVTKTVVVSDDVNSGCDGLAEWVDNKAYLGGDQVSYSGSKYQANWWTRGDNPAQNSGQWQVWTNTGSCD